MAQKKIRKIDKKKHNIKMTRVRKEAAVARKKIAARKASRGIVERGIDKINSKKYDLTKMKSSEMESLRKSMKNLKKYKVPMAKVAKRKAAKKGIGRAIAKKVPGVGAAIVAHDVMRAGAKKGCIKRGGEWVGGKCKVAKKPRTKASGPDKRFAKSRSKKK